MYFIYLFIYVLELFNYLDFFLQLKNTCKLEDVITSMYK